MKCLILAATALGELNVDLLKQYRAWTQQYEKDAQEANEAAKHYADLAKAVIPDVEKLAHKLGEDEMKRIGVYTWAHAAWQFEKMLENRAPQEAAKAAAEAAAPFNKAVADYQKAQTGYDTTAQMYALRVGMDFDLAKKLRTYAMQYKLQGNEEMEQTYEAQAQLLGKQVETFGGLAKQYSHMAHKIHNAIPIIQRDAGAAGAYAAYFKNPTNAIPPEHAFPFTVAPPI